MPNPVEVQSMFGRIARRYDLLNRVLSGGIDQRWRRRTVRAAERELGGLAGRDVLDVCCGTGDLALAFGVKGARVAAVDFTHNMLRHALPKSGGERAGAGPIYARGDALQLPLADRSVDVAAVAFGLRNLGDRGVGLAQMLRVLRPGGVALVLEFSLPPNPLVRAFYGFYFTRILPHLGALLSGDAPAYRYLPNTVLQWPTPEALRKEFEAVGFESTRYELLSLGIAALHVGRRPLASTTAEAGR